MGSIAPIFRVDYTLTSNTIIPFTAEIGAISRAIAL